MWSLQGTLKSIGSTSDLPEDFLAARGIRSLFPTAHKDPFSISLLNRYRYSSTGGFASEEIAASFLVKADGAGRWAYVTTIHCRNDTYNGAYGVGFLFDFSTDGTAHGYMQLSAENLINARAGLNPDPKGYQQRVEVTVQGFDPWIHENWPDVFAGKCEMYVYDASHIDDLSSAGGDMASKTGFSGLAPLAGATVSFRDVSMGGGDPGPPGGAGIGINWGFPPDDEEDDGD